MSVLAPPAAEAADPSPPFWAWSRAELTRALATEPTGLSAAEAARRLAAHGPNVAVPPLRRHVVLRILRKFAEPLVAILLVAAFVSASAGDWASFGIVLTVVVLSVALETFQERRAEAAAEALKRSVAVRATVLRDGAATDLPVEDLVPGDVVRLAAGDLVPADGVVLESRGAQANEALLTGEPYPVEKHCDPAAAGSGESPNALFAGTALVNGEARLWVVNTGAETRFGHVAAALEAEVAPTAFERGVHRLGVLILRLTGFLLLVVLLSQLAFHRPALESFMFAVALAVGLTPELLPMIMTVTLSRGAVRMAARKVVVKRLSAIHDLGAMDVLCTDKTGTLTEARVELAASLDPDGQPSAAIGRLAAANSRHASGLRTALDEAILARAEPDAGWTRIDDAPFDFQRRRVSVLLARGAERMIVVKGAPEHVLALCTSVTGPDGAARPLAAPLRGALEAMEREKAAEGFRLLAIAWKPVPGDCAAMSPADETDLVFAGFCIFLDPPKASATAAVARLVAAGIRVKVISGDAAPVVHHLVEALKLPAGGMLTGPEIERLTDKQLAVRIEDVDLFARVSPDQKRRILLALQARGHVVGFLGDGINDAPAIRAADVGLSVQEASDVARQAADMILLAQDLGVVADGVAEGRRTFANIMKYIRMAASSNFGNMLSMAVASVLLPFLPLLPVQVLANNFIYDLSETGIPFDGAEPEEIARPQHWDMGAVLRFTLVMGPLSSLFDLATFGLLRLWFDADAGAFRTAWFVESMATQILVIFVIRTMRPAWASRPHPILVATSLGGLAAAFTLVLTPAGAALGFAPLAPAIWGAIAGLSLAYLAAAEAVKHLPERLAGLVRRRRRRAIGGAARRHPAHVAAGFTQPHRGRAGRHDRRRMAEPVIPSSQGGGHHVRYPRPR